MKNEEAKKAEGRKLMAEVVSMATQLALDADVRNGYGGKSDVGGLVSLACRAAVLIGIENPKLAGVPWTSKPRAILNWANEANDAGPRTASDEKKPGGLKTSSEVFPDLKVGMRVRCTWRDSRGINLAGEILGFKDVVDLDLVDDEGITEEEEATVPGGAFVVLLDKEARRRVRGDNGEVHEIAERDVTEDEAEDWEVAS